MPGKEDAVNKKYLCLLLLNGKFSYLPISPMMLQNLGTFYFLSVSGQIMPRFVSGYTVIQKVRTWIDLWTYWFMAPL